MRDSSSELTNRLADYASGKISLRDLDAVLTEAEYDDEVATATKDRLAVIRLAIIEAGEGDATADDVLALVRDFLSTPIRAAS